MTPGVKKIVIAYPNCGHQTEVSEEEAWRYRGENGISCLTCSAAEPAARNAARGFVKLRGTQRQIDYAEIIRDRAAVPNYPEALGRRRDASWILNHRDNLVADIVSAVNSAKTKPKTVKEVGEVRDKTKPPSAKMRCLMVKALRNNSKENSLFEVIAEVIEWEGIALPFDPISLMHALDRVPADEIWLRDLLTKEIQARWPQLSSIRPQA